MDVSPFIVNSSQPISSWDEQACLQGCIDNDIISQSLLYKHYYPKMMAIVHRYTKDRDEACNILNNGFLKAFKKIHTFNHQGSFEGWLRKIIIHAVSDYYRYKHPQKEVSFDAVSDNVNTVTVSPKLAHDYQLLLKLLHSLTPTTRLVVNLFIIDGYTHKEIAKMMGISESTSKWHVAEGRKILQQQLSFMK